ncbi:acid phosphatase [Brooklawnia cerclae]|uniref:Phosphoglycerate mutase n=1 Tax=Brooklawnia cerclae TaxID=349934 RepID=A0ABX0SH24_9ACTN|nr:histidine phosphatase family protein [Brooklawnia cerclae]NIH57639.1 putative phosphoglycerate mutase [Brooklawnia cerclae]
MTDLYIVRHGETEWSKSGQHTSVTELELTSAGREQASRLNGWLDPADFDLILCSPRTRAQQTARLAGFDSFEIDEDLAEWDYGDLEGRTSAEIRQLVPGWRIWTDFVPGGEQQTDVVARMTRVMNRTRFSGHRKVIAFGHGHAMRVLATCWIGLPIAKGASLPLQTGTVSILGYEKETPAIVRWNAAPGA